MDHSLPYHHPLAQMPTDQREYEQHRLLVQTGLSASDGLFQVTASDNSPQSYHPRPPVENWLAFRSNPAPEALMPLHQTGFSNPWGATPEPYDFGTSSLTRALAPDDTYLTSLVSAPHANTNVPSVIASPTSMRQPSSRAPRRSVYDDLIDWQTAPATSSFLSQEHIRHSPSHLHTPEKPRPPMRALPQTPQSPPISISSNQSSLHFSDSMSPAPTVTGVDFASPRISLGDSSDQEHNGGSPYSRLIWEALMSTDEKMLPLQGIYQWFEKNTTKGKNDESKGWQNSIRHNLSMNAGFEAIKVETPGKKAVNYWRLTDEAIRNGGVQSTTRYRKMSGKKAMSSDPPDPRQRPGSKGGKKTAGVKRHAPEDEQDGDPDFPQLTLHHRIVRQNRTPSFHMQSRPQPQAPTPVSIDTEIRHLERYNDQYIPTSSVGVPQYPELHMPNGLPQMPRNNWQQFDLSSVIGTTSPLQGNNMMFCDTAEGAPDCAAFVGPMGWYNPVSGSNHHGLMTGPPEGASDHLQLGV